MLAEMAAAERRVLARSLPVAALSAVTLACRFNVLGHVREVVRDLALLQDHSNFVAQVLDVTALWVTYHDTWTRFHSTLLERFDPHSTLSGLTDRASSLFLQEKTNGLVPVHEMDVPDEEYRFLEPLGFEVATLAVPEWIEALFNRTDVLPRAAWTL